MTATPVEQRTTSAHVGADLHEVRARLLEKAWGFLSSPEVSASGYVKGIATPATAEGDQK